MGECRIKSNKPNRSQGIIRCHRNNVLFGGGEKLEREAEENVYEWQTGGGEKAL